MLLLVAGFEEGPCPLDGVRVCSGRGINKVLTVIDRVVLVEFAHSLDAPVRSPTVGDDDGSWTDVLFYEWKQCRSIPPLDWHHKAEHTITLHSAKEPLLVCSQLATIVFATGENRLINFDNNSSAANENWVDGEVPLRDLQ